MWHDLRVAARQLARKPLFSAGVIALLALGIAANTVIFSLVDALLLRPLPVRDPERLVRPVHNVPPIPYSEFTHQEYELWRTRVASFEDVLAWSEAYVFIEAGETPERVRAHFVTDNYFSALGIAPAAGRLLTPEDQRFEIGTAPVVLSHFFWKRRFSSDPNIVGRTISLNGRKILIVGITPKGFNGISVETGPELLAPIGWIRTFGMDLPPDRIDCQVAAYMKPGIDREVARQEAEALWLAAWNELNSDFPGTPGAFELQSATRGISRMRTQFAGVLGLLFGGVAILMLLVSANVAGLLTARLANRRAELAVRVAVGATRLRLMRELFSESLLLMLGATAAAIALSLAAIPQVTKALPPIRDIYTIRVPLALDIAPDWRILGFTLAVSAITVLLFGLLPALSASRRDIHPLLKEARTGGVWRGRQVLIVMQVALCTMLLIGAGLTVSTLQRMQRMDAGFDHDRVATFNVSGPGANYTGDRSADLQRRLLDGARQLPGVESAAISARGLMRGSGSKITLARSGEPATTKDFMNISVHDVSPEYFETMRISWLYGRNFTGREGPRDSPRLMIVNEAFLRLFGADANIIGQTFGPVAVGRGLAPPAFQVIGVVRDAKYRSLREPFQPIVYLQSFAPGTHFVLHVRTHAEPETIIVPMQKLLAGIDPRLSFAEIVTLKEDVANSLWAERVAAFLATLFSAIAALIAGAGLYALIAFAVEQRRREIGIRMALGAMASDVLALILTRAALLAGLGVALGVAASWLLGPRIAHVLYEVEPRDATILGAAAAIAFVVSALAASIPSRRATRLQPAAVLREE